MSCGEKHEVIGLEGVPAGSFPRALALRASGCPPIAFIFKKQRRNGSALYRSEKGDLYLRCGPETPLTTELKRHIELQEIGYPVARIKYAGETSDSAWYIEESLGERHFGQVFGDELSAGGIISDESFTSFLAVVGAYSQALSRQASQEGSLEFAVQQFKLSDLFRDSVAFLNLESELTRKIGEDLRGCPFGRQHGDFQPYNIFPRGVLDFEDNVLAPAGFDLMNAITYYSWFSFDPGVFVQPTYSFDERARRRYYEEILIPALGQVLGKDWRSIARVLYVLMGCWASAAHHPWRLERLLGVIHRYLAGKDVFVEGEF